MSTINLNESDISPNKTTHINNCKNKSSEKYYYIRDALIIHILLLNLNATMLLGIFHRLPDMLVPMHYLWSNCRYC